MTTCGNIAKMRTVYNRPVDYYLPVGEAEIAMNPLIGRKISIHHSGVINCIHCGKITSKSYNQGFCYQCLKTAPEADESVIRPELSKAHLGISRDMEWSQLNDLIDHFVYLSVTSDLKVGVTRNHQLFTRWIDQGAVKAVKLARTPNRHIAGIIEVFLKKYVADKTNWSKMLKGEGKLQVDLLSEKKKLSGLLPLELAQYVEEDNLVFEIQYPGELSSEVHQVNLDETPEIKGMLQGIKGQYLIFEHGFVFNVRKHAGYFINFENIG